MPFLLGNVMFPQYFHFLPCAGNADAQFDLGLKYENGQGVEKDALTAVKWYRKAADQGIYCCGREIWLKMDLCL